MSVETIHVQLLNEGVTVSRPTRAEHIRENIYRILEREDDDSLEEEWEFLPGEIVLCEMKNADDESIPLAKRHAISDGSDEQYAVVRQLLGRRVTLVLSDPWHLIEDGTNSRRHGYVSHVGRSKSYYVDDNPALIVKIEKPIVDRGEEWQYLLATERHADRHFVDDLFSDDSVSVGLTGIVDAKISGVAQDPFDLSEWRHLTSSSK